MTRKAKVGVSRQFILHAVREMGGSAPEDATLVSMEYDSDRDIYVCMVESDEYPDTPEGADVQKATVASSPEEFEVIRDD